MSQKAFVAYQILNDQLFQYIMNDLGDSDEADKLRDEMDDYWAQMTTTQRDECRTINERKWIMYDTKTTGSQN